MIELKNNNSITEICDPVINIAFQNIKEVRFKEKRMNDIIWWFGFI